MLDLSRCRLIDLSKEMNPGVRKVNGEYVHGSETRRLELRQFIYQPDKMIMHWVDTESHIGTHVEGPNHHPEARRCLADLPAETFMGEAVVLDFSGLKPIKGKGRPITPSHLGRVRKGDIVLMWSPYEGPESPCISPDAASYLFQAGAKMIGIQGIGLEAPGSMSSHETFLLNDIPVIEGLQNLDKIRGKRVFYIGLPIRLREIDSSWVRAVALEDRER